MVANDTRCVAYKRISGAPGQLLGYSFDEDQPREIEALAAGHKLQIVRWFDDVQSGGTAVRAGLMAMLEYCAAEQIRYVVAYKFDRISRIESLSERGMLLGALIANEIAVVTTDKVFDPASNPADILGYEVVSAVGAAYLRDLRQRIRLSWIGRFERCLYAP